MTASGEKMSLNTKSSVKWFTKDQLKQEQKQSQLKATYKEDKSYKKSARLTEAEKEERRREMMQNADWREKDRSEAVKNSRAGDEKEADNHAKEFDKNFLNDHLRKAQANMDSVESRIKSKMNNIQRSSRTMSTNFARR